MSAQPVPIERMMARASNGKTLGGRDLVIRDVSEMAPVTAPEAPEGLGDRGQAEWARIWDAGPWLWPSMDGAWVEQIARAYDDLETYRQVVAAEGLTVEGYAGQTVAHPLIREMRACEDTIRKCLSQLGFSPTDRARLKLTELKASKTAMDLINGTGNNPTSDTAPTVAGYVEGQW